MTRLAVCGGVYANPCALEAFVADARERGAERLLCLGDLGGFGADCDAVWPLLLEHGSSASPATTTSRSAAATRTAAAATPTSATTTSRSSCTTTRARTPAPTSPRGWHALPGELRETIGGVDVHAVHGSPLAVNDFVWESLDDDELRCASARRAPTCCSARTPASRGSGECDGTLVVNVGTIGRPANDGRRAGWYAIVDAGGRAGERGARAARLRLARAGGVDARGRACPSRSPRRSRPAGGRRAWRSSRRRARPRPLPALPRGAAGGSPTAGWADAPADDRPVMPLFGSPVFPPRLWIYTNFHCNLACDYCVVASSPQARKRSLGLERFRALVDEAVAEGFEELYVTGGEPFIEPAIVDMLEYASARLPTVCLTNAMLFRGAAPRARAGAARGLRAARAAVLDRRRARRRRTTAGAARALRARRWTGIAHAHSLGLPAARRDDRDARERGRGRGAARAARRRRGERGRLRGAPARRGAASPSAAASAPTSPTR